MCSVLETRYKNKKGIINSIIKIVDLTNRKWLSVVCTPIDNDIRHDRGQNVVDSRGAAA